jgi:peptide/nickel transport system substrate-binding protein
MKQYSEGDMNMNDSTSAPDGGRRRARRRWVRTTGAVLVCAGLAATSACSASKTTTNGATSGTEAVTAEGLKDTGPITEGGSLVIGVAQETSGWNPHVNQWAQWGSVVGSSILEPLAVLDANAVAQPWLATSFTPNATFDVWTLELRDDVTFQDGEPFDAAAVKKNIDDASKAPTSGVALAGLFKNVTVVGPHTVKVELNQPWAAFPSSFLAGQSAMMMAPAMLDSADAGQKHPIGTGPFTFDEWKPDATFRAKKNPTYWRKGEPHLDRIEFRVLVDPISQANALRANDVNMYFTVSAQSASDLKDSYKIVKNWTTEPAMLITNTLAEVGGQANPVSNKHARLALAQATDRKALAAVLGDGVTSPTSPFAPNNPWGQPEDQNGYPAFDLDKAKAEVEAYKKETKQPTLTLKLVGTFDAQSNQVLQVLQAQWKAAGIESTIENTESASFIQKVIAGNYQVALFPIYTSPDPDQNWYFWSSTTAKGPGTISINFSQFKSPAIDADLAKGRESADPAVRKAAYSDLVKQLNADAVNIWLYWTPYSLIADQRVHGLDAVAVVPFANYQPKTWFGQLWIAP